MTKANDFKAETKSRAKELKALATAKKIIKEATRFAQESFLQRSQIATRADLVNYEASSEQAPHLAGCLFFL
jgi:hypothetical protein